MNGTQPRLDGALRRAYLGQPPVPVTEAWRQGVLARIRLEPLPRRMPFSLETAAWRSGGLAAAAALLAACSLLAFPGPRQRLAWDLHDGGAQSEWILKAGGFETP